jgi:DNA invertase Pin-like site-specific DNA recombinase
VQRQNNPAVSGGSVGARAAQYVRMSTDHQKYSIHNQGTVIADYAVQRGLTIVRTYLDEGRSGLRIVGRNGLQGLIDDVEARRADFGHILVYDVSRWGRFQDVDESAYYEFICKRAGINVHYCADEFENDGSLASTILKTMKRAAGDFSRQLSRRMFFCQCHMTELGLWRGGSAGYGLRRLLVDGRDRIRRSAVARARLFEMATGI